MFRCIHGADPVPKIPLWPFFHAPLNGNEYLLLRTQGINLSAHSMPAGPGYINTAYSAHWADKIAAALMIIMIDGGAIAIVASLPVAGTSISTVYDMMARTLVDIIKIADTLKEQVKGLLGHMLLFAGRGANIAIEFPEKFIRWVFSVTISRLNRAARQALTQNS